MRDGRKTRARIEAEALRLFAEKGVDATSVRDIAQAVGVAEGALYRHFQGKDELARSVFLAGYAGLAAEVGAAAVPGRPLAVVVEAVVALFCRLFDEDRPRFSFLLLAQHDFLRQVPAERDKNLVEAVASVFERAMQAGEIPRRDPALVAAMALGIVAQPAVFLTYGRLEGALADRAADLGRAVLAMAQAG